MQHAKDFTRETVKRSDRETVRFVVDVREKNAITERATTCSTAYKAPTRETYDCCREPETSVVTSRAPLMIWKHQLGNTVAVLLPEAQPQAYSCSKPPALPPAIER